VSVLVQQFYMTFLGVCWGKKVAECEQGLANRRHPCIVAYCSYRTSYTFIRPRWAAAKEPKREPRGEVSNGSRFSTENYGETARLLLILARNATLRNALQNGRHFVNSSIDVT
jgi:hypothetical protein